MSAIHALHPDDAMLIILEYHMRCGIAAITVAADISQRLNYLGDLIIESADTKVESLSLSNVALPNWVAFHSQNIVKGDIRIIRVNLD